MQHYALFKALTGCLCGRYPIPHPAQPVYFFNKTYMVQMQQSFRNEASASALRNFRRCKDSNKCGNYQMFLLKNNKNVVKNLFLSK